MPEKKGKEEMPLSERIISPLSDEEILSRIGRTEPLLESWYRDFGRELPWREKEPGKRTDPYHVWLSEIMLQQTRVETVIPYYQRFLSEVPDIPALSKADDALLYKLWEGLGYYSRVRGLKKGAQQVMEQFGGHLPESVPLLKTISGIGEYTAGAIGSIAFGLREPAVDGNLLRVSARWTAAEGDIAKMSVRKAFHDLLLTGMERMAMDPGDYNQAMMDLGAGICIPVTPRCERCPVRSCCLAFDRDQTALFPVKAPKKERRIEEKTVLLLTDGEKIYLRRRPENGLLAGLWEFPMLDGALGKEETEAALLRMGIRAANLSPLKKSVHRFTHIEWRMKGFVGLCREGAPEWSAVTREELEEKYTLPSALRVYRKAAETLFSEIQEEHIGIL
ncbi:MAG: A/G-specific adenine glycosylase [Oscillospiraceae bacterium]|nr:A/G-specific adenine glycosylase [Oscillospiraceae bacterium]